ncbi:MAG: helix-turn-helix domain-containing protein [Phycisphaerae bacterium]|nr:helix-turn-helix domain-containing protein [Phycisphaerae bacterium]
MGTTPLLNIHGLARELRLPARWLMREATAGRIPALRIGEQWRFDRAAVEAALLARAQQPQNTDAGDV